MNVRQVSKTEATWFYFIFFFIALIIHFCLPLNWADDIIFSKYTKEWGFVRFISGSARPIIDTITYFFAKYKVLWRILNPMVLTLLVAVLVYYIPCKNKKLERLIVGCTIIFPAMIVVDAGFIATTVNYLWATTFGLIALIPLYKVCTDKEPKIYECIISVILILYATNMQQMTAVLLALFLIGIIYTAVKKKFKIFILIDFFVTLASFFFSFYLNMFGDNNRMIRETMRYFKDFAQVGLLEKIELGFSSTFYCLTMDLGFAFPAFLAFNIFIVVMMFKNNDKIFNKINSLFPIVFCIWGVLQHFIPSENLPIHRFIMGNYHHFRMTNALYIFRPIMDILFILICVSVTYSLFILIKNRKEFIACCFALLLGLGTRVLMGMSPTVWASGYRTFFIMFLSFIVASVLIIDNIKLTEQP